MTTHSQDVPDVAQPAACVCGAIAHLPNRGTGLTDPHLDEQPSTVKREVAGYGSHPRGLADLLDALDYLQADFDRRLAGIAPAPESEPQPRVSDVADLLQPFTVLRPTALPAPDSLCAGPGGTNDQPTTGRKRLSITQLDIPFDAFAAPFPVAHPPEQSSLM